MSAEVAAARMIFIIAVGVAKHWDPSPRVLCSDDILIETTVFTPACFQAHSPKSITCRQNAVGHQIRQQRRQSQPHNP
jgi:hypothetical protein